MLDQASKLRKMVRRTDNKDSKTRIFSVISGKKGLGKTDFVIDLKNIFEELEKSVIVLNENSDYTKIILELSKYNGLEKERAMNYLLSLSNYDLVIIDNGDGISQNSLDFTKLAHEAILVTRPDITAITESYKFLKVLNQEAIKEEVKILINNSLNKDNNDTFFRLNKTVKRFLYITIANITNLDNDGLLDLFYDSKVYDVGQLREKIVNIFGG